MKMRDGSPPKFKGVVLRELSPWLEQTFSEEERRQAFAAVPPALLADLDPARPDFGALASAWYDARIYEAMFDVLLGFRPDVDRKALARSAGQTILGTTLRGIYGGLFRLMATPALYARYVQKMWDTHYDTGTVTIEHESPTVALHRVRGWAGHHHFACEINRQSGAVVYAMMGVKNVRIVRESCSRASCMSVYAWEG